MYAEQKNKKESSFLKGFTLIETLIVIAIIGILTSIIIVGVSSSREKARIAADLQFSQSIKSTLGADLVGEWKFDEAIGSGTAVKDTSGNNLDLTAQSDFRETNAAAPQLGNCMRFYYTNYKATYYTSSAASSPLNICGGSFTITAWIRNDISVPNDRIYVGFGPGAFGCSYSLSRSTLNQVRLSITSSWLFTSSTSLNLGKWYFIAATYKVTGFGLGNAAIYIDGRKDKSGTIMAPWQKYTGSSGTTFYVGGSIIGIYTSNATIDDLRIYSESLNSAQIQQHYAEGAKKRGLAIKE